MKLRSLLLILIFLSGISYAQVVTENSFEKKLSLDQSVFAISNNGKLISVPEPSKSEISERIQEDSLSLGSKSYRFAKAIPVNINVSQSAAWIIEKDTAFGKLILHSANAVSLSVNFSQFYIPYGSEIYLYNLIGSKVGPINSTENNKNSTWGSPVLRGENLVIELKVPVNVLKDLRLLLSNIAYGYRKPQKYSALGNLGTVTTMWFVLLEPVGKCNGMPFA